MAPQPRHHRHAIHVRDTKPRIVDEYDFDFDAVKKSNLDEVQIPDILDKPKIVRRQVLTVIKTLTVTNGRSSATASAADSVEKASKTASSSKAGATSTESTTRSSAISICFTITSIHSKLATATPTASDKPVSSSVVEEETTSATPTTKEIKSTIATSTAAASSASLVTDNAVPTSSGHSTLLTVVTSSSASSSLAASTLAGSTTASSASSAASESSTSLGSASFSTGDNSNGSTDESSSTSSGSLSTGARAGIAIGVIVAAILIFVFAFLFVRRMKQRRQEQNANEKTAAASSSFSGPSSTAYPAAAHPATEKPPRLSIRVSRPVSGLLPLSLLSGRATRTSTGALHSSANGDAASGYAKMSSPPASIRSSTGSVSSINKGVEASYTGAAATAGSGSGSPASSYASSVSSKSSGNDSPVLVIPAPQDPFSPAATAAAAAAAGASASASPSTSNVHRAIMDFVPTMHDELALKDGQLVRVLHEYDDGWALCVKLDRSAQGVCPRSCLSVRALRPRPKRGVKGTDAAPVAAASNHVKATERSITNLPAVNTEAANANKSRPGMAQKMPSTPTIQVFAPDSERPFEVA
ncbi:hypothetical protein V1519DRAFT_394798 [Lipomyces tetrasporus]